jgi:histidinol dehydrogenase
VKLLLFGEKGFDQYLSEVKERLSQDGLDLEREVRSILKDVKQKGDRALVYYTRLFDGVKVEIPQLQVKREEVKQAYKKVSSDFLATLKKAAHRIRRFHQLTGQKSPLSSSLGIVRSEKGIRLGQMIRPLERVGIYVPGGKASYPSTVLMAAIPARVAGVQEILMTTPPQIEGIDPAVIVAADLAGVDKIYRVGGVQAIAALAYGTESIPKVDKIVGPGNRYVATAKRLVYGIADIDMVAGPSEIVVISDGTTPSAFVAADLISQSEHDEKALAILITPSEAFGKEVRKELERQLASLRRRKISDASLNRRGAILVVRNLEQGIALANQIAPEHLELCVKNPWSLVKKLKHAGAIFLGPYSSEAIGDYMAGPNHILPTAGTARFSSPLSIDDFVKKTNLISFSRNALRQFEKDIMRFAEHEGLEGHYQAVQIRMNPERHSIQGREKR